MDLAENAPFTKCDIVSVCSYASGNFYNSTMGKIFRLLTVSILIANNIIFHYNFALTLTNHRFERHFGDFWCSF